MKHFYYKDQDTYNVVFLVPKLRMKEIEQELLYLIDSKIKKENCLFLELDYEPKVKKSSIKFMREFFLTEVKPLLEQASTKYLVICDAEYFKAITRLSKAKPYIGYLIDCPYIPLKAIYSPSIAQIFYNPKSTRTSIKNAMKALLEGFMGTYQAPGSDIIWYGEYPNTDKDIETALNNLLLLNKPLSADIETFSLKHYSSGIGSIAFAWSEHEGIAFSIDDIKTKEKNQERRELLKNFFKKFNNKILWHNISFDAYILIYQLFMSDLLDMKGCYEGMNVMLKNWEDTKLITYLATNSCAGNELGLKAQSQEFAGNYAQDEIGDITKIPENELLKYNLTDALCTWYVYKKHYQTMINDNQLDIYQNLFKPAIKDIIQMQLSGMPLNMNKVLEAEQILIKDKEEALKKINANSKIKDLVLVLKQEWVDKRNKELKTKKVTIADSSIEFNPNSNIQLQKLLYDILGLPVLDYTNNKSPATGGDTLAKLLNHTQEPEVQQLLQGLIDYKAVDKILTAFIPVFKEAPQAKDGWHYLFGNFNLGGTVSGRLSSNNPNLQQIPATGSKYAKLIKKCFAAPPGWLMVGLDFNALEDHISALLTKDKNKLRVYTDGFDGHSLRAYTYFKDKMPDITKELEEHPENEVEIINSIKKRYKALRQASKAPTFALTYLGTAKTLEVNCGFSPEEAKHIEQQYHELYKESDEFSKRLIEKATKDGYITVAFGLRVRTPILEQTILNTKITPHEAEAEGRTANNAAGQSFGLLNSRAGVEFNAWVRNSKFKYNIKPIAQIHDAQYFIVKDDVDTILALNEHLVKAVEWQDDPAIAHDKVHLGGEVSIFYPDWAHELVLPNSLTETQLTELVSNYFKELKND